MDVIRPDDRQPVPERRVGNDLAVGEDDRHIVAIVGQAGDEIGQGARG